MTPRVEYLGYIIAKDGLHPTHAKVLAIQQEKTPMCVTELLSFLGIFNYYRKFLKGLSTRLAIGYRAAVCVLSIEVVASESSIASSL